MLKKLHIVVAAYAVREEDTIHGRMRTMDLDRLLPYPLVQDSKRRDDVERAAYRATVAGAAIAKDKYWPRLFSKEVPHALSVETTLGRKCSRTVAHLRLVPKWRTHASDCKQADAMFVTFLLALEEFLSQF